MDTITIITISILMVITIIGGIIAGANYDPHEDEEQKSSDNNPSDKDSSEDK